MPTTEKQANFCVIRQSAVCRYGLYLSYDNRSRQTFIKLWSGIDSNIPYYTALLLISPLLVTSIQSIGIEIQRAKDMHKFRSVLYFAIAAINNIAVKYSPVYKIRRAWLCAFGTSLSLVVGNIIIMNIYYHKRVGLDIKYFGRDF